MHNIKRRNLLLVIILLLLSIPLTYLFLRDNPPRILEIKLITNQPLCNVENTDLCPEAVSVMKIYEGSDFTYYPLLRVKRLDLSNMEADVVLTKSITVDLDRNDVQDIIRASASTQMPPLACKAAVESSFDLYRDTLNIRHFFLVPTGDDRLDGFVYFDRIEKISTYMEQLAARGQLFAKSHKPDAVNIIILKGKGSEPISKESSVIPSSKPMDTEREESTVENDRVVSVPAGNETIDNIGYDDSPPPVLTDLSVSHNHGANTISWASSDEYPADTYDVTITCESGCYDDGSDYSLPTRYGVTGNSITIDLSSSWDKIKQRKFKVEVVMHRGDKKDVRYKSGVKLFCQ